MSITDLTFLKSIKNGTNKFNILKETGKLITESKFIHKSGEIRFWSLEAIKIHDKQFLGFVKDITARKKSEERLKESERFLKETQIIANLGTYSVNMLTHKWSSSEVLNTICGIDADYGLTSEKWLMIVHPDHRKIALKHIKDFTFRNIPFNLEYKESFGSFFPKSL